MYEKFEAELAELRKKEELELARMRRPAGAHKDGMEGAGVKGKPSGALIEPLIVKIYCRWPNSNYSVFCWGATGSIFVDDLFLSDFSARRIPSRICLTSS